LSKCEVRTIDIMVVGSVSILAGWLKIFLEDVNYNNNNNNNNDTYIAQIRRCSKCTSLRKAVSASVDTMNLLT